MTGRLFKIFSVFLAFLSVAALAYADSAIISYDRSSNFDRTHRFDTGVYLAGTNIESGDGAGGSTWIGGSASYGLTPSSAFGFSGGYTSSSTDRGNDLEVAAFMADMIVRFPGAKKDWNGHRLVPYGVAGLGDIWRSVGQPGGTKSGSALGWKLGGGFDYFLSEHWAINFEIDFLSSFKGLSTHPDTDPENRLDLWTVGGGVKYIY